MYAQATTTVSGGALVWDSDGYYVIGEDSWTDVEISATFTYQAGEIGIMPRYQNNDTYLLFTIQNDNGGARCALRSFFGGKETLIETKELETPLSAGVKYEIRTIITGTNYKIYLDNQVVFNVEFGRKIAGEVGLVATAGNSCFTVEVISNFPEKWKSNVDKLDGAIVTLKEKDNEDKYIYLYNPTDDRLYIDQEVMVNSNQDYALSFDYFGDIKAQILEQDGSTLAIFGFDSPSSVEWSRYNKKITTTTGCTKVIIRMYVDTDTPSGVNDVQLEASPVATGYIANESIHEAATRDASIITYPSKNNINKEIGSISMWVKHVGDPIGTLFEYGDEGGVIRVSRDDTSFLLTYGSESVSTISTFNQGEWSHIVATWSSNEIVIAVDGVANSKNITQTFTNESDVIRFGHSYANSDVFQGAFDEAIIYQEAIDEDKIIELYTAEDTVEDEKNMVFRATFDYAIGNFNSSVIELTQRPEYRSPIIVQKEDGTNLRKISFFNEETGEYRTFNEEMYIYDGKSDYLEISFSDIDTEGSSLRVYDEEGIAYGSPYTVDGKRVYLTLSSDEKNDLRRKKIYVQYRLNDSYVIEHNIGAADSFRVELTKHDGKPITVTYEGDYIQNQKLATMIEMNPLLNPNHQGFLYITNKKEPVSSYRVKATPSSLLADGLSEALVLIEPLDANGNYINHANLVISAKHGEVTPMYDVGSVTMRELSGRYLYKYNSPLLQKTELESIEIIDRIYVQDKETNIGVQIPISLILDDEYVTDKRIVSMEEKTQDKMCGYLFNMIMKYWQQEASKLPRGLGGIIDLNGDGIIDIEDIKWIANNKHTQALTDAYNSAKAWK